MDGNQLALQMRRQLRELHASFRQDALYLVAIPGAFGGAGQIEQARVPAG
jgi:hypothetical protein